MNFDKVIVYESDDNVVDKYTVVTPDGNVFGMSNIPFSPLGFNQWVGMLNDFPKGLEHTGRRLKTDEIPEKIKKAILARMK